jgi:hypothetical protein
MINLGRWQGGEVTKLPDLNDATLIAAAKAKVAELSAHDNPISRATQVLIWDDTQTHNLIAVVELTTWRLTVL